MRCSRPLSAAALSILVLSGEVLAQSCTDVIELAKTTAARVYDRETIDDNAAQYCSEYAESNGGTVSSAGAASYNLLSASMSSGRSSYSEVAGQYCSTTQLGEASTEAYKSYVTSINPAAFDAYEQCLTLTEGGLSFSVDANSRLPTEFTMSASYSSNDRQDDARVELYASSGLDCSWRRETTEGVLLLLAGQTAVLTCLRESSDTPGYVRLTRLDVGSGGNYMSVRWPIETPQGVPIDLLADLRSRYQDALASLAALDESLEGAVVAFEATACPAGWSEYAPLYGRFIRGIDKAGSPLDPEGQRQPGSLQGDAFRSHSHSLRLAGDVGPNRAGNAGSNRFNAPRTQAMRDFTTTSAGAGGETRPANVALLYCKRL